MLTTARRHPELKVMNHLDRIYEDLRTEYRHYVRRHDFKILVELISLTNDYELIKRDEARWGVPTSHMLKAVDVPYSGSVENRQSYSAPVVVQTTFSQGTAVVLLIPQTSLQVFHPRFRRKNHRKSSN